MHSGITENLKIKPMTKQELITEITTAFEKVKLEDGIGIWEAQGIDDYADLETIAELRKKDERHNWNNIPYKDLADCSSSLSFFDAKGMRFSLPKLLVFDILADEIYEEEANYSPDVVFTLGYNLDEIYQKNRFSLFDKQQIQAIIHFLEYKLEEIIEKYKMYSEDYAANPDSVYSSYGYLETKRTLEEWRNKDNKILCFN